MHIYDHGEALIGTKSSSFKFEPGYLTRHQWLNFSGFLVQEYLVC